MRALVVTNMWPSSDAPARGRFVRDQVAALRALPDIDLEVFAFAPGDYARAAARLRRRYGRSGFDVVHAHFGLTAWPALAVRGAARAVTLHGTDVRHPRSGRITRAVLGRMDLVATVSAQLAAELPPPAHGYRRAVLPCGVDTGRFRPLDRRAARERLGLDPGGRYVLFPADPGRPGKRADRAREVAGDATLLTLGAVEPSEVPLWVNSADAVVVPSVVGGGVLMKVVHAMALGCPVVTTPGPARSVDADDSMLFEGSTPEELAAAITAAVHDPELAAARGRNARQHIDRTFRWDDTVRAYLDAYAIASNR